MLLVDPEEETKLLNALYKGKLEVCAGIQHRPSAEGEATCGRAARYGVNRVRHGTLDLGGLRGSILLETASER
ncbi:hypothetical protein PsYK624_063080 [Phanerochaete sordida]|uniref:Uncharacterized protein n=1 Tax=Phanerochaete sordida TaxID=48140 RepID=A0A9P3G8U0_9APHY|nr:hypothetical protein PsYK624_063080 [Phanerochaete sordida]